MEDNAGDVALARRAFRDTDIEIEVVKNGEEALERIFDFSRPPPDVILLDLNLPRVTGWEVLEQMKRSPLTRSIPVVVMTSSEAEEDILSSYNLHANAYMTKPVTPEKFKHFAHTFHDWWYVHASLADRSGQ